MSKNNHANHSNHLENHDLDNFSKTGYSNSRLNRHKMSPLIPKLSFDAMTIVGNLSRDNALGSYFCCISMVMNECSD